MDQFDRNVDPRDEWQNRLFKLLPAEFTGLFLVARTLADTNDPRQDTNIYLFSLLLLLLLPFFNSLVLGIKRFWKQNFVICISFVIWLINIELFRLKRGVAQSIHQLSADTVDFWAPIIMGLWLAIILPLIFRKRNWDDEVYKEKREKEEAIKAAEIAAAQTLQSSGSVNG